MCDKDEEKIEASQNHNSFTEFQELGASIIEDVDVPLTPNQHENEFEDGILDRLSPIRYESLTLHKMGPADLAVSTPRERSSLCRTLNRKVKRRRRSTCTILGSKQRKRVDQRSVESGCNDDAPKTTGNLNTECPVNEESAYGFLSGERTIVPNSLPNSPIKENPELIKKPKSRMIKLTDSLQLTTDMHSKLGTTFDDFIESNDVNLSFDEVDKIIEKGSDHNHNSFYGLPNKTKEILKQERGIEKLYDWQNACLSLPALQQRKNLIYSLPTSGGKTLVAEVLIMKELLLKEKNAILILPYVSIVQEKVRGLSPFAVELGFHVEEYAGGKGSFPPKKRRKRKSLYIATIEKADAIINNLIENERIEEIGLTVVDELHMIGERGGRGAKLEMCLTKILCCNAQIQIIGMSATLGNLCDLQTFLNAEIYCNEFRPVELSEYIKLGDTVFEIDQQKLNTGEALKPVRTICHPETLSPNAKSMDPDHLTALAMEVIPNNSCLVFCSTKKNCENVAVLLTKCAPSSLKDVKGEERQKLLKAIRDSVKHVCSVLRKTIPFGIAYHHGGLTIDERKLIEDAYSSGVLCLLCCTSTLAAGVNLPAKRVILRAPYMGNAFLTKSRYNQMIGRAGRAGIDSSGESIMVIKSKDKSKVLQLLQGTIDKCYSNLDYEESKGLRAFILNALGLKLCSKTDDIEQLLMNTLFYVQAPKEDDFSMKGHITSEIEKLTNAGLIQLSEKAEGGISTQYLEATRLGIATFKACLDVDKTQLIYKELVRGTKSLVVSNELHLLYLVTPLENVDVVRLDWTNYYQHIRKLSPDEMQAAELIGISESFMTRKAAGRSCLKDTVDEFVLRRFLITLMIYQYLKEIPIWKIADNFDVTRGFVQSLMTSACSFTYMLINFTKELPEFWSYSILFEAILQKLSYAATVELIPLMEIPGVKQARARQLYKAGFHTLKNLAWANADDLCRNIEHLPRKQANLIISSAKMLLQEKAESLRDEVEEMMMKP